ncbi:hypothetical protein [Endozoicomonas numazuensis]|uniref:Uncharacterized protein n=1 Tax=Endozoicomonas numazuensis TaxID=1137799 RepID=A0A081N109_9GAMM|nr:hypothetical protein [Endozoicomonas numazuensis]KEQ12132.1 hypothetical protein GZ78_28275 [Endozoicomonas numazuensis]
MIFMSEFPQNPVCIPASQFLRDNPPQTRAITEMTMSFSDLDNMNQCLKALQESDERLLSVSDSEAKYDWRNITVKGRLICFGVQLVRRVFLS